jgi:hypothetical protein
MRQRGPSGTKKILNQRAREQPTAEAIAATWQELMFNFRGCDVNGDVDERIQQCCKIRSDRYKRAIVGGRTPFIKGNDCAFFIDVLEPPGRKGMHPCDGKNIQGKVDVAQAGQGAAIFCSASLPKKHMRAADTEFEGHVVICRLLMTV